MADDEQHLGRVAAQCSRLRVETAAQLDRLVEHALRRRAPLVDRLLRPFRMPAAALAQAGHVVVGELLPALGAVEAKRGIEQRRLQLHEAGHAGHRRTGAAVVEQRAEGGERVAEGVVAGERLHRRPRAAVRRAEHEHARAVARQHALPGVGLFERHGARDQAAHRMGDDAHRLLARGARRERVPFRAPVDARKVERLAGARAVAERGEELHDREAQAR